MPEIEIKLQVPEGSRAAVSRAMRRGRATGLHLVARYFDTPDRRLAAAGLALRLRREGRRWVQTVKGVGDGPMARLEHDAPIGAASSHTVPAIDLARHEGTDEGRTLRRALGADGAATLALRFETDVRRIRREVRLGATRIELAFDQGMLRAGDRSLPVCELELEWLHGPLEPMVALAGRWAARHDLWFDARSKAERGHWLAEGAGDAPVAKAGTPVLSGRVTPDAALRACVRSALAQVALNGAWLAEGSAQPEHVHQARVGLRRLTSVLREFGDWSPDFDARWIESARSIFGQLSAARDRDALDAWLWPALREADAPPFTLAAPPDAIYPGELSRAQATTQWLLELLSFAHGSPPPGDERGDAPALRSRARKPLARLHRQVTRAGHQFDALEDEARHRARKRLKRLRYAAEALSALWPAREWRAYAQRLRAAQDALGRFQDLTVAEPLLREAAPREPGAAFGLGWIAAKRGEFIAAAGRAMVAIGPVPGFLRGG
jgi:inorganic triphosphatase YgiF